MLFIVVPVTVLKVESPARNVDELAVPDPNLALGTVPDARFDALRLVKLAPDPEKVVAVVTPVANISPSLLRVIPLPTTIPFHAVTKPTASLLVTSS